MTAAGTRTVAQLIVECLENEGVEVVFGLPGEENLHMIEALASSSIRFVTTRDERGASFMADTYGALTGRAGVCLATLGPGAINLMLGVANAQIKPKVVDTDTVGFTPEQHDGYIRAYLVTGRGRVIGRAREVLAQRKDGSVFPNELSIGEVRHSDRRLFTGIVRDITQRKTAEAEARQSLAELESSRENLKAALNQMRVGTVVVDQDPTRFSRELVDGMRATQTFAITRVTNSPDQARELIAQGTGRVGVVIPPDFHDRRARHENAPFLVLIDGSDSNVSAQALASINGLVAQQNLDAARAAGAIGRKITLGAKLKKATSARAVAERVKSQAQSVRAKPLMPVPYIEINCPAQRV